MSSLLHKYIYIHIYIFFRRWTNRKPKTKTRQYTLSELPFSHEYCNVKWFEQEELLFIEAALFYWSECAITEVKKEREKKKKSEEPSQAVNFCTSSSPCFHLFSSCAFFFLSVSFVKGGCSFSVTTLSTTAIHWRPFCLTFSKRQSWRNCGTASK